MPGRVAQKIAHVMWERATATGTTSVRMDLSVVEIIVKSFIRLLIQLQTVVSPIPEE